ncbi:MAG: hypothetical protein DME17_13450 [Candidatus Rokuibacteriota bacterium]|nr:MAG: hypothetical protein DME17_13450 [Candidatus Rokubacteria bacterium]
MAGAEDPRRRSERGGIGQMRHGAASTRRLGGRLRQTVARAGRASDGVLPAATDGRASDRA